MTTVRIPTDAYDYLVFTFDESGTPYQNSVGSGLSSYVPLAGYGSYNPGPSVNGLFSKAVSLPGPYNSGHFLVSSTQYGEYLGAYSQVFTLSAWFFPTGDVTQQAHDTYIAGHAAYTLPFGWHGSTMSVNLGANLTFKGTVNVGGSYPPAYGTIVTISGGTVIPNQWNHIGITMNNGTLKLYGNGKLLATKTGVGSVTYQGGQFLVGGTYTSTESFTGLIDDTRFANTDRAASWFDNVWTEGSPNIGGPTVMRQDKAHGSPSFNDSLTLEQVAATQTDIQGDLDAIRSQIKRAMGTLAWSDDAPISLQTLSYQNALKVKKGVLLGSAQAGDRTLNISSIGSLATPYDQESDIDIFVDGVLQIAPDDYTMASESSIQFAYTLGSTDKITVIIRNPAIV